MLDFLTNEELHRLANQVRWHVWMLNRYQEAMQRKAAADLGRPDCEIKATLAQELEYVTKCLAQSESSVTMALLDGRVWRLVQEVLRSRELHGSVASLDGQAPEGTGVG